MKFEDRLEIQRRLYAQEVKEKNAGIEEAERIREEEEQKLGAAENKRRLLIKATLSYKKIKDVIQDEEFQKALNSIVALLAPDKEEILIEQGADLREYLHLERDYNQFERITSFSSKMETNEGFSTNRYSGIFDFYCHIIIRPVAQTTYFSLPSRYKEKTFNQTFNPIFSCSFQRNGANDIRIFVHRGHKTISFGDPEDQHQENVYEEFSSLDELLDFVAEILSRGECFIKQF